MNNHTLFPLYLKANFIITAVVYLAFLVYNQNSGFGATAFSAAAAISTAATLYLIYYILLRPFAYLQRSVLVAATLIFLLTNLALIVDFFIFRIWKFHINAMVLNILFSPAAFDSIQTGIMPVITAVAVIAGMIAGEIWLIKKIASARPETAQNINRRFNTAVFPLLFVLILSEKVTYGIANMYATQNLLVSTKPIPLYQPMDFTKTVERLFDIKAPERDRHSFGIAAKNTLHYPLEELQLETADRPDIFWFVIDSARYDMLNEAVMPASAALAKQSWNFSNNISGGNTTRFGIFSLFYGINSSYWFSFLNAQKGPVLFETLNRLDYGIRIISSTDTRWPEFQQTTYFNVLENIQDSFKGLPHEKDRQSSDAFIAWLDEANATQPLFGFVFLDGPHGPTYPDSYAKFQPDNKNELNYLTVTEADRTPMINQYKNALLYSDSLLKEMLDAIEHKGRDKDAIIIVTSDHGQEYYEYGNYGHNSAYNHAQVKVPLIIRWPDGEHRAVDQLSSSLDIAPTLLRYIGVTTPPERYSNGFDLRDPSYARDYAFIGNWNDNAIVSDEHTYVFSNMPDSILSTQVRATADYSLLKSYDKQKMQKILLDALDENSKFVR